jgi:hypothetical protein
MEGRRHWENEIGKIARRYQNAEAHSGICYRNEKTTVPRLG